MKMLKPRIGISKGRHIATVSPSEHAWHKTGETAHKRGYGHKWRVARASYLAKHPLCVHCERQGIITVATDLDHIIPHRGDKAVFWDHDNWQPLCKSCHSVKTQNET